MPLRYGRLKKFALACAEMSPKPQRKQLTDKRVDAYIAQAPPFAQPILRHLRELVHRGCPGANETVKWRIPFFEYKGQIICNMAAFKQRCMFGFWAPEMRAVLGKDAVRPARGNGWLRRITRPEDLPGDRAMLDYIKKAAEIASSGRQTSPMAARRKSRPELPPHPEFAAALKKNKKAAATLEGFPPGRRREYLEWINGAKQDQTRTTRIATAVTWLAQGKSRNWKYESR
jgi:uncharacterized protein YdeI (YjbR/CyaY-like superfamily)